jgi:glucose-1-phosphate thymidylyltransferase
MKKGLLKVEVMGRGIAWLDTGTYGSLLEAANFVETIQNRQGLKIACLEEIAYRSGFIDKEKLHELGSAMSNNEYGRYLLQLTKESVFDSNMGY